MSATATTAATSDTVCIPDESSLPDSPFTALRYHFGMLLGVEDFSTEQRYHRGKVRLHQAWLHRAGIVWGLGVEVVPDKREFRVESGLALDPTGRELHLDVACCMDIGKWYDENEQDVVSTTDETGAIHFDGRIELVFCSCGTRPVPAISTPCEGANADTAYSRTFETVSIRFVPELAVPDPPPYPRLRLLFGIDDGASAELSAADVQAVEQARAAILTAGAGSQTFLDTFRSLADQDVTLMQPAAPPDGTSTVYPALDDAGVVLANVKGITLVGSTGSWTLTGGTVDTTPRRVHVATQTIEELLCGDLRGAAASGPQVAEFHIDRAKPAISIVLDKAFDPDSVQKDSFAVSQFQSGSGWSTIGISKKPSFSAGNTQIDLVLDTKPQGVVRFIAYGTGQTPILGADPHVPLAGAHGGPPGTENDGHDYVYMSTP